MTPSSWFRPPPHERGLSSWEQEARDSADPNYDYCVIRKNYDMQKQQVWFCAQDGQSVVGRSRLLAHRGTFLGDLKRFDRDLEAAYDAFILTLLDGGWEPVGGGHEEPVTRFRRLGSVPGTKTRR